MAISGGDYCKDVEAPTSKDVVVDCFYSYCIWALTYLLTNWQNLHTEL
jgi:hypothetical protein